MQSFVSMVFSLALLTGSSPVSEPLTWNKHAQPGGGSVQLPAGFTVIRLSAPADKPVANDGVTSHFQELINAKGSYEGIVCSVRANRRWREDAFSRVLRDSEERARSSAEKLLSMLSEQDPFDEPLEQVQSMERDGFRIWRGSLSMLGGASRLDFAIARRNGFQHYISAVYSRSGEHYWKPRFDEILLQWEPGTERGETSGDPRKAGSNEWIPIDTSLGLIWFPAGWTIIERNVEPQRQREGDQIVCSQKTLNVRPGRYPEDISVFQLVSTWIEDSGGAEIPWSIEDARIATDATLEGYKETFGSQQLASQTLHAAGQVITILKLSHEELSGVLARVAVLHTGNKVCAVTVCYPQSDDDYWSDTFAQVIRRMDVETPALRSTTQSGLVEVVKENNRTSFRINWPLMIVSFLITWTIGLIPPLAIRFLILRRPVRARWCAGLTVVVFWVLNIGIFTSIGTENKHHAALGLVMIFSYIILRGGHAHRCSPDEFALAQARTRQLQQETHSKVKGWGERGESLP